MPKVMWAPMGKLVPQLPGVVTFAYNLHFRHVIACWKGIFKNYTLCHQNLNSVYSLTVASQKKHCLGPQNGPRSTERCTNMKNSKISQLD
jgi:hypothetical protein